MESEISYSRISWLAHQHTLVSMIDFLLSNEDFADVTIACEGKYIRAHRMVLAACSPYFQELLSFEKKKHPVIYLKDVKFFQMEAIIGHMYRGEFDIPAHEFDALIEVANGLKIRGLANTVIPFVDYENKECDPDPSISDTASTTQTLPIVNSFLPDTSENSNNSRNERLNQELETETSEQPMEISKMFYNNLLGSAELQELLAGKITECLDSTNSNDVVKAATSKAGSELLDTFFGDFFDIDFGGDDSRQSGIDSSSQREIAEITDEDPFKIPEVPLNSKKSTDNLSSASFKLLDPSLGSDGVEIQKTPASNSSIGSTPGKVLQTMKSPVRESPLKSKEITVTQSDGSFFTIISEPVPRRKKSEPSKTKQKPKRPRLNAPVSTSTPVPKWRQLGRASIDPKIPCDEAPNNAPSPSTLQIGQNDLPTSVILPTTPKDLPISVILPTSPNDLPISVILPKTMKDLPISVILPTPLKEVLPKTPLMVSSCEASGHGSAIDSVSVPKTQTPTLTQRILKTVEANAISIENISSPFPASLCGSSAGKNKKFLSSILRAAEKIKDTEPSPKSFETLEKPKIQESATKVQRKSFSTPRKRKHHVRNLHFNTPPTHRALNDKGEQDGDGDFFFKTKRHKLLSSPFRSTKKLEWGPAGAGEIKSKLADIEEIEEQNLSYVDDSHKPFQPKDNFSSPPPPSQPKVNFPSPHPPPPEEPNAKVWIPPPTPRTSLPISDLGWKSPLPMPSIIETRSLGASWLLSLHQLMGTPLKPGEIPRTPGHSTPLQTNQNQDIFPTYSSQSEIIVTPGTFQSVSMPPPPPEIKKKRGRESNALAPKRCPQVLALQQFRLPFAKVGLNYRAVAGHKPTSTFKIGEIKRTLSVSQRNTVFSTSTREPCKRKIKVPA